MKLALVAISGGVDSGVSALLLKQQGWDVVGLHLKMTDHGADSLMRAKEIAQHIGIELMTVDVRSDMSTRVIEPFARSYELGLTPNPCVVCNVEVKFWHLLATADRIGADIIATGHYAQVEKRGCRWLLLRGTDATKDQSYMLYRLKQHMLSRISFPLGMKEKAEVAMIAKETGIAASVEGESQDVCFFTENEYRDFIEPMIKPNPGNIVDIATNEVISEHDGIHRFTIGQRKGLGINTSRPSYVVDIDPATNTVYIGSNQDAHTDHITAVSPAFIAWDEPPEQFTANAVHRYRSTPVPATVHKDNGCLDIRFHQSVFAPAPGQAVVFYEDSICLGGATISRILH